MDFFQACILLHPLLTGQKCNNSMVLFSGHALVHHTYKQKLDFPHDQCPDSHVVFDIFTPSGQHYNMLMRCIQLFQLRNKCSFLKYFGFLWTSLDFFGFLWISLDFFGFLWIFLDFFGFFWFPLECV